MKKQAEALEIGTLFQELNEKGFNRIGMELGKPEKGYSVLIQAMNPKNQAMIIKGGDSLVFVLGLIVDKIRLVNGEPSRNEELAELLAEDQRHVNAPPFLYGPLATCGCGSNAPLIVERNVMLRVSWETGLAFGSNDLNSQGTQFNLTGYFKPASGEFAKCPECGKHYIF